LHVYLVHCIVKRESYSILKFITYVTIQSQNIKIGYNSVTSLMVSYVGVTNVVLSIIFFYHRDTTWIRQ